MIQDKDSEAKQEEPQSDESLPDERLFELGKIKIMFDRVKERRKGKWDPTLRARIPIKKNIVQLGDPEKLVEDVASLSEDCLGLYETGNVVCYIVMFSHEKYACEVFVDGQSRESVCRKSGQTLVSDLYRDYPLVVDGSKEVAPVAAKTEQAPLARGRGRPRKVVNEEAELNT